jgi:hypothetical protein
VSKFSWIAFPRELDKDCLKRMTDKSKRIKAKDLKETESEGSQSTFLDPIVGYSGDLYDLYDLYDVYITEIGFPLTFKKVFANQYIYSMDGQFGIYDLDAMLKKVGLEKDDLFYYASLSTDDFYRISNVDKKRLQRLRVDARRKLDGNGAFWAGARCSKQLYDLIKHNTSSGEIVEIYSCYVRGSENRFGPPKETEVFGIEGVLTSDSLRLEDRIKIEICNTG